MPETNAPVTSKSNSLKQLGYTIEPVTDNQNGVVFKVTAPPFLLKKTKSGKLRAFKSLDAKSDSTIEGLYGFEEKDGDIIGSRPSAKQPETAQAA